MSAHDAAIRGDMAGERVEPRGAGCELPPPSTDSRNANTSHRTRIRGNNGSLGKFETVSRLHIPTEIDIDDKVLGIDVIAKYGIDDCSRI
jgi:hypothetical protein